MCPSVYEEEAEEAEEAEEEWQDKGLKYSTWSGNAYVDCVSKYQ